MIYCDFGWKYCLLIDAIFL